MARCVIFAMAVALFAGTASATTFWGVSTSGPDRPPAYILPPDASPTEEVQKSDESVLPRPEVVTTAVTFWTRVYTEVDTDSGFIHDSRHLDVVYEAIELPENASRRTRSRVVEASKKRYSAILKKLAAGLFYRLKVVTVSIPPLRERPGDIPMLLKHFLEVYAVESGRGNLRFSGDAMRKLMQARWEGNVRELRNLVESLTVLAPQDEIRVEDLPEEYRGDAGEGAGPATPATAEQPVEDDGQTMEEIERRAILNALEKTGGNRTRAAGMLGIGLRTLQRKLKEYRLAGKG